MPYRKQGKMRRLTTALAMLLFLAALLAGCTDAPIDAEAPEVDAGLSSAVQAPSVEETNTDESAGSAPDTQPETAPEPSQAESEAAPAAQPPAAGSNTAESPAEPAQPDASQPDTPADSAPPADDTAEPAESATAADTPPAEPVCTVSISCAAILDNWDLLDPDKAELVPADGWLLTPVTVTLSDGESAFDVLLRVCQDNRIHLEYQDTPAYGSAYIEGIGNLYEFDCGDLSGWMFRVNGEFSNYGCSEYTLADGDVVEWVYTCDLGADVGGGVAG